MVVKTNPVSGTKSEENKDVEGEPKKQVTFAGEVPKKPEAETEPLVFEMEEEENGDEGTIEEVDDEGSDSSGEDMFDFSELKQEVNNFR